MKNLRLWDKQSNINVMGNVMTPTEVRSSYPVQKIGRAHV